MSEIIGIDDTTVKIGTDDGKVVSVPTDSLNFSNPQVGDEVRVYKDGANYIIHRTENIQTKTKAKGTKSINKHMFVWVFAFLLGWLGVDRFVRGKVGSGICKLLVSWLTLGIWPLVDWIIAMVKAYGSAFGADEEIVFGDKGQYTK